MRLELASRLAWLVTGPQGASSLYLSIAGIVTGLQEIKVL